MKDRNKIFIILNIIIILLFISPVLAEDIEWVDPQEKTLRLAESVTRDGFIIEATDFFENSSLISVYDLKHDLISRNVTRINDSMEIRGQLNISIKNLKEKVGTISANLGLNVVVDQWVRIETRVAGRPLPRVSISPPEEKIRNKKVVRRSFAPGSEISINFSVRNDGKAVLEDTILKINSSLPLLVDDKLYYELLDLGASNRSEFITVRFRAPAIKDQKNYQISAEARGKDIFGKNYNAVDSIDIEVKPQIDKRIYIRKYVTEKVYMGDIAVVSIYIKNNESRKLENLILEETLSGGLIPINTNLSWNFSLGPFEQKSISYKIKPEKPGTYFFPPGSARIEYEDSSEFDKKLNKLIVNGPYVILTKSANIENPQKGDNVTITIEAKNVGNEVAIARIADSVPVNYSLVSGNMSFSPLMRTEVLRAGNSTSFSYKLNIKENGLFNIPPVKATILDQFLYREERYSQKVTSSDLVINVRESTIIQQEPVKIIRTPAKTATPEPTITTANTEASTTPESTPESTPGFSGYIVIMVIFTVKHIIKKKNSRNEKTSGKTTINHE